MLNTSQCCTALALTNPPWLASCNSLALPFGIDLNRVRFLAPSEHSDELFYAEATRQVKKDNTFSFAGRRYETPVDLRNKEVQLRYDRCRSESSVVILYYKNERLGAARLLDAVANGLLRRKEQA